MWAAVGMFAAQTALQLGSAIAGASADVPQYNRKVRAINAEGQALQQSYIFRNKMLSLQEQQLQQRAALEEAGVLKASSAAKGTATAAAATGGVEGRSVSALLTAFDVATGSDISSIYLSRDNALVQAEMEKKGAQMDTQNRLRSLAFAYPESPTAKIMGRFIGAAMGAGEAFISNTTKVPSGSGDSGFLGTGRRFG